MPQNTIDHPYQFQEIPSPDHPGAALINIWVGEIVTGVVVAGAVKATSSRLGGKYDWIIASTIAPDTPVVRAKDEDTARKFLVFLADLYTGRLVKPPAAPVLAGYLAAEGIGADE